MSSHTPAQQWDVNGEELTPSEAAYVNAQGIIPGFMDHSSREVLEAFRAGYRTGTADCCDPDCDGWPHQIREGKS